jgi:hypothetical protein
VATAGPTVVPVFDAIHAATDRNPSRRHNALSCNVAAAQHTQRRKETLGLGALLHHLGGLVRREAVALEPGHDGPDQSQHLTQRTVDPSVDHTSESKHAL